jgi:hypothetical protein
LWTGKILTDDADESEEDGELGMGKTDLISTEIARKKKSKKTYK